MRARVVALLSVALLAACHRQPASPHAAHAWVRLPAVAGGPAAAYLAIEGGRVDERLIKVESAMASRAELHASMAGTGGTMRMAPLDAVDVPAGRTTLLAPEGRHVMLFDLDPAIRPGTAVPLRLGFASGRTAEAEAKSVAAGDAAPY